MLLDTDQTFFYSAFADQRSICLGEITATWQLIGEHAQLIQMPHLYMEEQIRGGTEYLMEHLFPDLSANS